MNKTAIPATILGLIAVVAFVGLFASIITHGTDLLQGGCASVALFATAALVTILVRKRT